MKQQSKKVIIICCLIAVVIIAFTIVFVNNRIRENISSFESEMADKYPVVSFQSEEDMIEAITGSWAQTHNFTDALDNYMNFNDYIYSSWGTYSDVITKSYTLDYQNGKIVFDDGYYYVVITYKNKTYILTTPNAKSEEYYYFFRSCNEPVPE